MRLSEDVFLGFSFFIFLSFLPYLGDHLLTL